MDAKKTLTVIFDGQVLCPEELVDLEPNVHYIVTVERKEKEEEKPQVPSNRAFRRILERATNLGISDLAEQHDYYFYGTEIDHARIEELAEQIISLDSSEQEVLLDLVAELNFQRGLKALSDKYRARLALEGKLEQKANKVLAELRQIREDIAASDYQN